MTEKDIYSPSELKTLAESYLNRLGVSDMVIREFLEADKVHIFGFGSALLSSESIAKVEKTIEELESRYGVKVYAVVYELMFFGETFNFLCVSKYIADTSMMFRCVDYNDFLTYAYVFNTSSPECSEFGMIGIRSSTGYLRRID